MDYRERWREVAPLGEGGQGRVLRVIDRDRFDLEGAIYPTLAAAIRQLHHKYVQESTIASCEAVGAVIRDVIAMDSVTNHAALKVLHRPRDSSGFEKARARIQDEIRGMQDTHHPSLIAIHDSDPDGEWFVSEFHPGGTLLDHLGRTAGDPVRALRQIRPVVAALAMLHEAGAVHRDVKPQNIFVASDGRLVLGDFGLVYFADDRHTRVSECYENVGSRDWMPGWAQGRMIKEIRPSFDVYSIGKVIWAMVSGRQQLQHWYFPDPEFDLCRQFPADTRMPIINDLLARCVVEREVSCLLNASELLALLDETIARLEAGADLRPGEGENRRCLVCGSGRYKLEVDQQPAAMERIGIQASTLDKGAYKAFVCDHCGHLQLFYLHRNRTLRYWPDGYRQIAR